DGHSHVLALPIPNLLAYDPAYAYEIAVIVQDGIRRMYAENEDIFYYLTVGNEPYPQPAMPEGCREGILRGIYRFAAAESPAVHLLGSGAILNEVVRAQSLLAEQFNVPADVWSVTSYKQLRTDALKAERWNLLHPDQPARTPYLTAQLGHSACPYVAASDYSKVLPDSIARWLPGPLVSLGTDGFGRSEARKELRGFFEVDARYVAVAALFHLARLGKFDPARLAQAIRTLDINPEKLDPMTS
ncbi:MAG: pyruvate dehydrogenase (acetyl-transferring), homodimeric type, partial [Phycisphaerae bacterium]|nr:pyruvate dehydrogenase (acetyl-transferring), homodimeric type [Phycisphaerae bacterium]